MNTTADKQTAKNQKNCQKREWVTENKILTSIINIIKNKTKRNYFVR